MVKTSSVAGAWKRSKPHRRSTFGALLILAIAVSASGDCSPIDSRFTSKNPITTFYVTGDTEAFGAAVQNAINNWNEASGCGNNAPTLTESSGVPAVNLNRLSGLAPNDFCDADAGTPCACATVTYLDGSPFDTEIEVYEFNEKGNPCNNAGTMEKALTHEFGHAFGFDNAPDCDSVMGAKMSNNGTIPNSSYNKRGTNECADLELWYDPGASPGGEPPCAVRSSGSSTHCPATPLVLSLDQKLVQTTGINDPVLFDLDADGTRELMTWVSRLGRHGFLAMDLNSNGVIDDGSELFGIGTVLPNGQNAAHGFAALEAYDTREFGGNGDGMIDAKDGIWPQLRVWLDRNHNAQSEPGEIKRLRQLNIVGFLLDYRLVDRTDPWGNTHLFMGTFLKEVRKYGSTFREKFPIDDIAFQIIS